MKPAAKAILILSIALALALGWIIVSALRGDPALKDAQLQIGTSWHPEQASSGKCRDSHEVKCTERC